jgi:hypothetical protein
VFETEDVETLSKVCHWRTNYELLKLVLQVFRKEAIIWRQLAHPNLLPFFGIFYQEINNRRRLCLVAPWMEHGHIYKYLKSNPAGVNRLTLVSAKPDLSSSP